MHARAPRTRATGAAKDIFSIRVSSWVDADGGPRTGWLLLQHPAGSEKLSPSFLASIPEGSNAISSAPLIGLPTRATAKIVRLR